MGNHNQKLVEEIFSKYKLVLVGGHINGRIYRFEVQPIQDYRDPLTYDELKKICSLLNAICIDIRMTGVKDYTWQQFYTSVGIEESDSDLQCKDS